MQPGQATSARISAPAPALPVEGSYRVLVAGAALVKRPELPAEGSSATNRHSAATLPACQGACVCAQSVRAWSQTGVSGCVLVGARTGSVRAPTSAQDQVCRRGEEGHTTSTWQPLTGTSALLRSHPIPTDSGLGRGGERRAPPAAHDTWVFGGASFKKEGRSRIPGAGAGCWKCEKGRALELPQPCRLFARHPPPQVPANCSRRGSAGSEVDPG